MSVLPENAPRPVRHSGDAGHTASTDLHAPVTSDIVLEVRVGKMKPLEGLKILSGIDKTIRAGLVHVTPTGIADDGHDYTFHGGLDKAIHGYCSAHYDAWKQDYPSAADRFRPGGFGENLVFARFNERNVHIGDVYSVGPLGHNSHDGLLLQVSLPRQPCFKLNHRFGVKNLAPQTWKKSRTGWYYRVLREGPVQAGDEVRLVERRHAAWPLERVQEYLHRNPNDAAMTAELAAIEEFGDECKDQLRSRMAKQQAQARRLAGGGDGQQTWRPFRVVEKRRETARVTAFVLETAVSGIDGSEDTELLPGSHVKLRLGNGLVRAYSVVAGNRQRFEIGVALDVAQSRGGSQFLHEAVDVGSTVEVGRFTEGAVPMAKAASHHVLVAGGVGITALLTVMDTMKAWGYSLDLHYAVRSQTEVAYATRLAELAKQEEATEAGKTVRVHMYAGDKGQRLDIGAVVRAMQWNTHLCVCGPPRLTADARAAAAVAGLGPAETHFEAFDGDANDLSGGRPFTVVVANRSRARVSVAADDTLLDALQRRFGSDAVPSSCEVGNCATCRVTVRNGRIEHRGTGLTDEERCTGDAMLACVSRGMTELVVEI